MKKRRRLWPAAIAVVVVSVGVTLPAIRSSMFIDGPGSILRLPVLSHWRNVPDVFSREFMIFTDGQYRPLSYALIACVRTWVGADAAVFWNAWLSAFRAIDALLVFFIAAHFARGAWPAFIAGALFAASPMTTMLGSRMAEFHVVPGAAFFLGAFLGYLRFRRTRGKCALFVGLLLFACGLLTWKAVFALPILILAHELFHERSRIAATILRVSPFVGLWLAALPLRLLLRPHPIFYPYPRFAPGATWRSICGFVGRTGTVLGGLFTGNPCEAPLREVAPAVASSADPRFIAWSVAILLALALAVFTLRRGRWFGVGIILAFAGALPFVSTATHEVWDYISWSDLFLVPAGVALAAGGLVDQALRARRGAMRLSASLAAILLAGLFAGLSLRESILSRSPRDYWSHVLADHPGSETASVELGRAILEAGDADGALRYLYSPAVKSPQRSDLLMMAFYRGKGELSAAAVHFDHLVSSGIPGFHTQLEAERTVAELMLSAGALDHVEDALALPLTKNRWDVESMRLAANVLGRKGKVRAAEAFLRRALRIDPNDFFTREALGEIEERMYDPSGGKVEEIVPPSPYWMNYVINRAVAPKFAGELIEMSERFPRDPVVAWRAAACLLDRGENARALVLIEPAADRMPHDYLIVSTLRKARELASASLIP